MSIPNTLTVLRLVLSPVFMLGALLPQWVPGRFLVFSTVLLWVVFVLVEVSDVLDGAIARKQGLVSDLGKILDPFADVVSRLSYFFVFSTFGIMPAWMFALILYRELGSIFVRMLMMKDGIALAARSGGKAKAVIYALSSAIGLAMLMHLRLQNLHGAMPLLPWLAIGGFGVSVLLSWGSFIDYLIILAKHYRSRA